MEISFVTPNDLVLLGRLALSCILGGLIGYERESKSKSAGLRTNMLVCLGSCLIMILSTEIYSTVEGKTNADPARLAAQVVSGIGFLGAGAIMKEGLNVTGLTTAACLWVVAGVGLSVGAGYYMSAFMTAALVFLVLEVFAKLDSFHPIDKKMTAKAIIKNDSVTIQQIYDVLKLHDVKISQVKMKTAEHCQDDSKALVEMDLINTKHIREVEIMNAMYALDGVETVEMT
ncbi:Membrane protein, MgtC/SapB family [Anaerovibrio sp. JC8]|uniref:MgtC/SapB family protein n=1 Tax=Anaerovibrio sp. JC8 TaxID=1240085 RepID=UPI000A0988AE|nr:MgtC/SapB family protein [Anaerovibrio sp. JC8]ORT99767.1 Membrane protein, MgtC/SapB family [Anaerovibrio sp. JC8]